MFACVDAEMTANLAPPLKEIEALHECDSAELEQERSTYNQTSVLFVNQMIEHCFAIVYNIKSRRRLCHLCPLLTEGCERRFVQRCTICVSCCSVSCHRNHRLDSFFNHTAVANIS